MHLIIEAGSTPRAINGPLNIAGATTDLRRLAEAILQQIEPDKPQSFVRIPDQQPSLAGTRPLAWDKP